MKFNSKYSYHLPYLYFIAVISYWFTDINRTEGLSAYPILLFAIPFLWQILKPNKTLNLTLGIVFICLSSYMIIAYLTDLLQITSFQLLQRFFIYGGILVISNFIMSVWIIKNSLIRTS